MSRGHNAQRLLTGLVGLPLLPALLLIPTTGSGRDTSAATTATPSAVGSTHQHGHEAALPQRPLPPDMIEGFGEGRVLAFHYQLSYFCPTTPDSDLDGPFGHGDGHPQAEDPKEYQVPTCFVGNRGAGPIVPEGVRFGGSPAKKLYGIVPFFGDSIVHANGPGTDVQTQCSQPGPPITQVKGLLSTCLMHPTAYRIFPGTGDPQLPDPTLSTQHSHIIEGTRHPAGWWNAVIVTVTDRSIWPDQDGKCPAGPPACLTSVAALRTAQADGRASLDASTNLYFFFSVARVGNAG